MKKVAVIVVALAGCAPTGPGISSAPPDGGRPTDATSSRVSGGCMSNLYDLAAGAIPQPGTAAEPAFKADWNVPVGGAVNGGAAVYTVDSGGVKQSCLDRLYVPVNVSGAASLWVFDNLYATDSSGAACTNGTPPGCSPSANGHCPVLQGSLNVGQLNGSSLSVNATGTRVYAAAANGMFTTVSTGVGRPVSVMSQLDTRADTGFTDAAFLLSTPWPDYSTGAVYAVVAYSFNKNGPTRARLYKLTADGAVTAKVDLPAGVEASPLEFNNTIYIPGFDGLLYRVDDNGSTLTVASGGWPLSVNGATPITSSPALDFDDNLLFVCSGNKLILVNLSGPTTSPLTIGSGASTGCTSSPWADSVNKVAYIGHASALLSATYGTTSWASTARSLALSAGVGNDSPKSSPIVLPLSNGNTYAFIGDSAGVLNKAQVTASSGAFGPNTTFSSGDNTIDAPPLVDVSNGNIYFGGSSRFYQITQASLN